MNGLFAQFRPHYAELRGRLLRVLAVIFAAAAIAYCGKDILTGWCMAPLRAAFPQMGKLVYTSLPEALLSYIKLSLAAGFIVGFPYLLHQAWAFAAPGLKASEQRPARRALLWGGLLFLSGAAFAFFAALPLLLRYFMAYASADLIPMLKLGRYLGFVARLTVAFALAFEIPFLMVMAVRAGFLPPHYFRVKRVWSHSTLAVAAFMLAAGDFAATALLCLPLSGLYEAGILACRVFGGKKGSA